jgi:oxidase EvaA
VDRSAAPRVLVHGDDELTPARIARSARAGVDSPDELADFHAWFTRLGRYTYTATTRVPLDGLTGWTTDPHTGNIAHTSGRFFTVEGLEAHIPDGPVERWRQPIIVQREVGILGILVKEFDGVLHCLMQAKAEPGNGNGLQLSPTVQATRSNYTRVHQGRAVPYLDRFLDPAHRRVVDVRQSEQGAWFLQKRNRNMVVEVTDDVEPLDGFRWMTLGLVHRLLGVEDMVNMDARTVLSCLPFAGTGLADAALVRDPFTRSLVRSCRPEEGSLHAMGEILSWVTERRAGAEIFTRLVPLNALPDWRREAGRIRHHSGLFFDVIGVSVAAAGREVAQWMQPMIEPHGTGVVAFLVREIGGVLHVLVHARIEPGYLDVVELAPTVQCTPENYDLLPSSARPRFLDEVLRADGDRIRYFTVMSEEGGRFHHARNRYLIVETDLDPGLDLPDHRWMTLHQLVDLLRHSHYVNVQARSLVACLHSLFARGPVAWAPVA